MPKVLLFDLDQTLLNRHESLLRFLDWQVNFLQLVPQHLKAEFIQRFITLDDHGQVWKDQVYTQLIAEFNITTFSMEALLQNYITDFNKFCVAFEQVPETIQQLHAAGYRLGLISNGKSPFQEHNFYALGLTEYFSCVIVSEAVGLRKPDPQIFHLACERLNCQPADCIFMGDHPEADIRGAKNAGMYVIYFHPTTTSDVPWADASIQHYAALPQVILHLNQQNIEAN